MRTPTQSQSSLNPSPFTDFECKNIYFDYSRGEAICIDTGEVLMDHLPASFLGVEEVSPAKEEARRRRYQERINRIERRSKNRKNYARIQQLLKDYRNDSDRIPMPIFVEMVASELEKAISNGDPTPTYTVASALGCSTTFVRKVMRRKLGMLFTKKELELLWKVLRNELTTCQVANLLNVSYKTVYIWKRWLENKIIEVLRQEFSSHAETILKVLRNEYTQYDLARIAGISTSTACRWIRKAKKLLKEQGLYPDE